MKRLVILTALATAAMPALAAPPPPFPTDGDTSGKANAPWAQSSIMDVLDNAKPWPSTAASGSPGSATSPTSPASATPDVAGKEGISANPSVDRLAATGEPGTGGQLGGRAPSAASSPTAKVAPSRPSAPITVKQAPARTLPQPSASAVDVTSQVVSAREPLPVDHIAPPSAPRVPAIQRAPRLTSADTPLAPVSDSMPPPVNLLSGREASLTSREEKASALARTWITGDEAVVRGSDGRVVYRFGGPLPTVVCAPLMVCDIELQPGERVINVDIGDQRFTVSFGLSGSGSKQAVHVRIKPTDTDLITNLNITTDRRTYVMKLVSRSQDWMPIVAFNYPEDAQAQLMAIQLAMAKEEKATVMPDTGQNLNALDFNYKVSGDSPKWRPLRVYTDGKSTFIQFPPKMLNGEAPVLVALGDSGEQLVNYRVEGDRYMVDRVLDQAALIVGVGRKQTKVDIRHVGAQ